jgi:hypothetical protein
MKKLVIGYILILFGLLSFSQKASEYKPGYIVDGVKKEKRIYYEKILEFQGLSIQTISDGVKKFLAINSAKVTYENKDEIYAMGTSDTKTRTWFLFFFNTKKIQCCI